MSDAVMHCNEFVEVVTDYLEGALAPPDVARLEAHLGDCVDCAHHLAQLQTTLDLTGRLTPADVPPAMREELLGAFSRWQAERRQP